MKKTTKGALAAVAGGALAFGGAGSLAYWNGNQDVPGATINSGSFTLSAPVCDNAVVAGTHDWQLDDGSAFDPATDTIVPGDTLTKICSLDLDLVGNHIGATLAVDPVAWTASNDLTTQLVPTAVFLVDGAADETAPVTTPGPHDILATITVAFDGVGGTNLSQNLAAALDAITVTATQTHDLT